MGLQILAFAVLPLAPTFYSHRWSHRVIHWELQIHEWSVFAVLILQFFSKNTREICKNGTANIGLSRVVSVLLFAYTLQQSQVQFFAANSRVAYSVHYGKVYAHHKAVVDGVESRKPQLNFCM